MSNIKLYFTDEEMTDFLIKRGYNVTSAKCWYSQSEYHNDVSFHDSDVMIAYKEKDTSFSDIEGGEAYRIEVKHGVEQIFHKELKTSLLEL